MWYLMARNDPGPREKLVLQMDAFEKEREWDL